MELKKRNRLQYDIAHKKIKEAIHLIADEGGELSVANVARRAGVCVSTAYNHDCTEMIRQVLEIKET